MKQLPLAMQAGIFLALMTLLGITFLAIWEVQNNSTYHNYLLWNLTLAWVPFIASLLLVKLLEVRRWMSWLPLFVTVAWLLFLPNTFYMLTDYIHLHDVGSADRVFDAVMFSMLIAVGIGLGFASLALIHRELNKRVTSVTAWRIVGLVLLLTSFAIYVGRELRWNSWDVIVRPAGILFDLSEILLNPAAHPQVFITTVTFFVLLTTLYYCGWQLLVAVRHKQIR